MHKGAANTVCIRRPLLYAYILIEAYTLMVIGLVPLLLVGIYTALILLVHTPDAALSGILRSITQHHEHDNGALQNRGEDCHTN